MKIQEGKELKKKAVCYQWDEPTRKRDQARRLWKFKKREELNKCEP